MKIVFMGTSDFALPSFIALNEADYIPIAVVTRQDKPKGRGLHTASPPIALAAKNLNILLLQPEKLKDIESDLIKLAPDLIVTAAYGKILPPSILQLPNLGCINLHPSLLPKYRGASPIEGAIMAGETETGVTTYIMDAGLDSGDIVMQRRFPIYPEETGGELSRRLAQEGARLLVETIKAFEDSSAGHGTPQDSSAHTMTHLITSTDTLINWGWPDCKIVDLVRALSPHIGAYTFYKGKRVKIWKAKIGKIEGALQYAPGEVIKIEKDSFILQTQEGMIVIIEVQLEGRAKVGGGEFARGVRLQEGDLFGE